MELKVAVINMLSICSVNVSRIHSMELKALVADIDTVVLATESESIQWN